MSDGNAEVPISPKDTITPKRLTRRQLLTGDIGKGSLPKHIQEIIAKDLDWQDKYDQKQNKAPDYTQTPSLIAQKPRLLSRRNALKGLGVGLGTLGIFFGGKWLGSLFSGSDESNAGAQSIPTQHHKTSNESPATTAPTAPATPSTSNAEAQVTPTPEAPPAWLAKYEKMSNTQVLNEILSKPPSTKERRQGEEAYFLRVYKEFSGETKLQPMDLQHLLDLGLTATQDPEIRAGYIDLSFKLRQANHPILKSLGFKKVNDEIIKLAVEEGVHPEAYGMGKDGISEALSLLYNFKHEKTERGKPEEFLKILRPDLVDPNIPKALLEIVDRDPSVLIPNAGAVVKVLLTETGFKPPKSYFLAGGKKIDYSYPELIYPHCNIGSVPAKGQLRGSHQGTFKDLVAYAKELSDKEKVFIDPNYIAGSAPRVTGEDESGGAVAVQMMPIMSLDSYKFSNRNFGRGLNIFTRQGATAICIYHARSEEFEEGERFGFIDFLRVKNALDKMENVTPEDRAKVLKIAELDQRKGTEKWNVDRDQVNKILMGAANWHEKMVKTGKSEF